MTGENPFNDCARLWRRRYQNLGHSCLSRLPPRLIIVRFYRTTMDRMLAFFPQYGRPSYAIWRGAHKLLTVASDGIIGCAKARS
jgi:hypothetical protein